MSGRAVARFPDGTLLPQEAARLCALGLLREGARPLAALARETHRLVSFHLGASLDAAGESIAALPALGLARAEASPGAAPGDAVLHATQAGEAELRALLASPPAPMGGELGRAVASLKLRFAGALPDGERRAMLVALVGAARADLARRDEAGAPATPLDGAERAAAALRLEALRKALEGA
ncbi:MAG: hypothetical protein ACKOGH_13430 [Alphaproteobacteria bacterium]